MAVLMLAVGIGLTTSMFSLLNVMVLEPLPFSKPQELVRLFRATPDWALGGFAPADFEDLKASGSTAGSFAAYEGGRVSVSDSVRLPRIEESLQVSPGFFDILGVRPQLGRGFRESDASAYPGDVVLLSHAFWMRRFGGDPSVIGSPIRVDGASCAIIGVLPEDANDQRLIREAAVFRPLVFSASQRQSRSTFDLNILGRRAPGCDLAKMRGLVSAIGAHAAAQYPKDARTSAWRCTPLNGSLENPTGKLIVGMLIGLSAIVLLIACSNLANFVLARVMARTTEIAVRSALGASRLRIVAPILNEALILAASGCAGAVWVAVQSEKWLNYKVDQTGGMEIRFPIDWRVLTYASIAALLTAAAFSAAPILLALRIDADDALRARGVSASRSPGHRRLRRILLIAQFAMAMTLLGGATFFMEGTKRLLSQHFGWSAENTVVGAFELPASRYANSDAIRAFDSKALDSLRAIPGAVAASLSYGDPYSGTIGPRQYVIEGMQQAPAAQPVSASYDGVTPDYFSAVGTPLLAGRPFRGSDGLAPAVVIINRTMARDLFGDASPLGRRIAVSGTDKAEWAEIVGVAADVRSAAAYERPTPYQVYHPFFQSPWQYATITVRLRPGASESALKSIQRSIAALDRDLPVQDLMPASARVAKSASDAEMIGEMVGVFAILGLLLAATGIYGAIEWNVSQRTGEIGIRMALGATKADIYRLLLGFGLNLAILGTSLGVVGAYGVLRFFKMIMPSLPADPAASIAVSAAVLVCAAFLACLLPSRRGSAVEPATALRAD
jgi:predicted permease